MSNQQLLQRSVNGDTERLSLTMIPCTRDKATPATGMKLEPVPLVSQPQVLPSCSAEFDMIQTKGWRIVPDPHSQHNIRLGLQRLGVRAAYDEFTNRVYLTYKSRMEALDDVNERRLWLLLEEKFKLQPTQSYFREVILNEAHLNSYHAVRDYLGTLAWDGVRRIDKWLVTFLGAPDNEYVRVVGVLWLMAAVRRVRQPGCRFDEILVCEGEQGTGKSSALQALLPVPNWFTDNVRLSMSAKEIIEQTEGKWIVEIPELAGMSGAEIEHIKSVLSRAEDAARQAYGRHRVDRPRQFVQAATTNDSVYLRDTTGNRRFWPVATSRIEVDEIAAYRDQLWAEAALREAGGVSIRLPEDLWPVAALDQEQRVVVDPMEDELVRFLPQDKTRIPRREIWAWIGLDPAKQDKKASMRLTQAMKRLGWRVGTVIDDATKKPAYGFIRKSSKTP